MLILVACILSFVGSIAGAADRVRVRGYTKKDGTYVAPHERSSPNAFKWDNNSYTTGQPAYNPSFYQKNQKRNSDWTQPNPYRLTDNNPANDNPPAGAPFASMEADYAAARSRQREARRQENYLKEFQAQQEWQADQQRQRQARQQAQDDILRSMLMRPSAQTAEDDGSALLYAPRGRTSRSMPSLMPQPSSPSPWGTGRSKARSNPYGLLSDDSETTASPYGLYGSGQSSSDWP